MPASLAQDRHDGSDVVVLADALALPSPIAIDTASVYVGVRGTSSSGYRNGRVLKIAKP